MASVLPVPTLFYGSSMSRVGSITPVKRDEGIVSDFHWGCGDQGFQELGTLPPILENQLGKEMEHEMEFVSI